MDRIVSCLQLHDIAALRLTSRATYHRASQGSFAARFEHKNIELTVGALQNFERMTHPGSLGLLLQHCIVTGILRVEQTASDDNTGRGSSRSSVRPENASTDDSAELVHLLTKAFSNLKQNGLYNSLVSLSFRVDIRTESLDGSLVRPEAFSDPKAIWDTALQTFNNTMAALEASELHVTEKLDVFASLKSCSLMWNAFLGFSQKFPSEGSFRTLKKLSISLSAWPQANLEVLGEDGRLNNVTEELGPQSQSRTHQSSVLWHILQLSRIMPSLEALELHWYVVKGGNEPAPPSQTSTPQEATSNKSSMSLKECILRGVYISETDLLHFLTSVHPASVTLEYTNLISGSYVPIFDYLTGPDSPVTSYHLDDLTEPRQEAWQWDKRYLVHFEVPGRPKFRYAGDNPGPSTLARHGRQVKDAIHYRWPRGRAIGSGELRHWRQAKLNEFGSAAKAWVNFISLNWPKRRQQRSREVSPLPGELLA